MPSIKLGNNLVYRDGNIHQLSGQPGDAASSGNIIRKASADQIAKYGSAGRGAGGGTKFINASDFTAPHKITQLKQVSTPTAYTPTIGPPLSLDSLKLPPGLSAPPKEPYGFIGPSGIASPMRVPWINKKTGETFTATSTGFTNPDPNWVPNFQLGSMDQLQTGGGQPFNTPGRGGYMPPAPVLPPEIEALKPPPSSGPPVIMDRPPPEWQPYLDAREEYLANNPGGMQPTVPLSPSHLDFLSNATYSANQKGKGMPSIKLGNNLVYRDGNIHQLSGPGDAASSGNILRKATPEQIAQFGSAGRGAGGGSSFINASDFTARKAAPTAPAAPAAPAGWPRIQPVTPSKGGVKAETIDPRNYDPRRITRNINGWLVPEGYKLNPNYPRGPNISFREAQTYPEFYGDSPSPILGAPYVIKDDTVGETGGTGGTGGYPTYIIPGYDPTKFEGGVEQVRRAEAEGRLGIPALPPVPEMRVAPQMEVAEGKQLISSEGLSLTDQKTQAAAQADPLTGAIAAKPSEDKPQLGQYEAKEYTVNQKAEAAINFGGPSDIIEQHQASLNNKLAVAATEDLDERATVQFQLGQLFSSLKEGEPLPAWAAPTARNVDAFMLKRGLGASSMAAAARTQALMESGIDIAKVDAEAYRAIQTLNLTNKQQTVITNATNLASIEKANLDAREIAAVNNAQNFLQLDLKNLTNKQRAAELDHQAYVESLTKNQASVNAARQFNAKTKNEVDIYFANLDAQIADANANRIETIERANADARNTMTQFYENNALARETFNVNMLANIKAANAKWFQSVSTVQNSNQMLANSYAAQSELGLRTAEYNYLWQKRRDDAQMLYESTEADLDRAAQAAALAQQAAISAAANKQSSKNALFSTVGTIAGAMIMKCWVAREVYDNDKTQVHKFRFWLENIGPKWFKTGYKKYGEKTAEYISDKPVLKAMIKLWMDSRIKKVEQEWQLNKPQIA